MLKNREAILSRQRAIECLRGEIDDLAKEYIPDFHFLDFAVSTFWECDGSPIGMCVFRLDDSGRKMGCRYCGGPVERK